MFCLSIVAVSSGVKQFILRSTLHPSLIETASLPNRDLLKVEQEEAKVGIYNDVDEEEEGIGMNSTGSIFAWHRADQVSSVGMLYVILALILVHGRAISDCKFFSFVSNESSVSLMAEPNI